MKIKNLMKLADFQTYGGPICICNADNKTWNGSLTENGDYWQLMSILDNTTDLVIKYTNHHEKFFILINENSGFYVFSNQLGNLILVEVFYINTDDFKWEDLEFEVSSKALIELNSMNGCIIFDSSLSLENKPKSEGFHKIDSTFYNYYRTDKVYKNCNFISMKNEIVHLEGIVLS
jgi:hypothetical protein